MLVIGVVDVGICSEESGERSGVDECKARKAAKRAGVGRWSALRRAMANERRAMPRIMKDNK
jgi:hypothetical protein